MGKQIGDSRKLARLMMDDPTIAACIFRCVAEHGQTIGAQHAAKQYPDAGITAWMVQKIIHRKPPFDNSLMFIKVNPIYEEEVTSRFNHRGYKLAKSNGAAKPEIKQQTLDIPDDAAFLHELIDAKLAIEKARQRYETALSNAEANGLHKATIRAFLSMLPETLSRG